MNRPRSSSQFGPFVLVTTTLANPTGQAVTASCRAPPQLTESMDVNVGTPSA